MPPGSLSQATSLALCPRPLPGRAFAAPRRFEEKDRKATRNAFMARKAIRRLPHKHRIWCLTFDALAMSKPKGPSKKATIKPKKQNNIHNNHNNCLLMLEFFSLFPLFHLFFFVFPMEKGPPGNEDLSQISARGLGRDFYWPPWPRRIQRNYTATWREVGGWNQGGLRSLWVLLKCWIIFFSLRLFAACCKAF